MPPDEELQRQLERAGSADWRFRTAAARSLAGYIDDVAAFDRLVEMLSDEDTAVVEAAVQSLVKAGGEKGLARVLSALATGPDDVGYQIRDTLVALWLGGVSISDMVRRILLEDPSASERSGGEEILRTLPSA